MALFIDLLTDKVQPLGVEWRFPPGLLGTVEGGIGISGRRRVLHASGDGDDATSAPATHCTGGEGRDGGEGGGT